MARRTVDSASMTRPLKSLLCRRGVVDSESALQAQFGASRAIAFPRTPSREGHPSRGSKPPCPQEHS